MERLINLCKDYQTFVFLNLIIKGNRIAVVKRYEKENPSKKFRTWLIDSNLVVGTL